MYLCPGGARADDEAQRIQLARALRFADSFGRSAETGQQEPVPAMRAIAARIERDRPPESCFRRVPLPVEHRANICDREMGVRQVSVELQRALRDRTRGLERRARHHVVVLRTRSVGARQVGVRRREVRIRRARLAEVDDGLLESLVAGKVPVVTALQIRLVHGGIVRRMHRLFRQQFDGERLRDASGHFRLHRQAIGQVSLVHVRPEMRFARRLDQLRGNPDAVRLASHAAFEQIIGAERLADLARAQPTPLEHVGR